MYVYVCVCMHVCLCMSVCVYVSVFMHVYICLVIYVHVHLCTPTQVVPEPPNGLKLVPTIRYHHHH